MIHDRDTIPTHEHTELIDMRTHLTVAMLAASQLNRKTQHVEEATHLQCYLDQSLKSLVEDVGKVDALLAQVAEPAPMSVAQPSRRRWPLPLQLAFAFGKWCGNLYLWIRRKRYVRPPMVYLSQ